MMLLVRISVQQGVKNRAKKSSDWLRGDQRPRTVGESSSILINAKLRGKIYRKDKD